MNENLTFYASKNVWQCTMMQIRKLLIVDHLILVQFTSNLGQLFPKPCNDCWLTTIFTIRQLNSSRDYQSQFDPQSIDSSLYHADTLFRPFCVHHGSSNIIRHIVSSWMVSGW
jgi:hypothetical protein